MKLFLLNYQGNKYAETNKYLNDYDISKYDIIAEPFCGIFGFSRCLFALNPNFDGLFYLNDINTDLVNFFIGLKDKEKRNEIFHEIDELIDEFKNQTDNELSNYLKNSNKFILKAIFIQNYPHLFNLQKGINKLVNFKSVLNNYDLFFEKCVFTNMKSEDFIKILPTDKKILVFYDPPYFDSSNKSYADTINQSVEIDNFNVRRDNTGFYVDIIENFKNNKNVDHLMILNKIDIINYIFKDYYKSEHTKTYSNQNKGIKNRTTHIIYEKINEN